MEQTWKKMLKAGVTLGYGSGATPVSNGQGRIFNAACNCSHGVQSEMFPIFVSWGATPLYTLAYGDHGECGDYPLAGQSRQPSKRVSSPT